MKHGDFTTEECVLNDLAIAFESGCSGVIIDHLDDDFIFDSPKLKRPLDKQMFEVYIEIKLQKLKEEGLLPAVRLFADASSEKSYILELLQKGVKFYVNVDFKDGKLMQMEVL